MKKLICARNIIICDIYTNKTANISAQGLLSSIAIQPSWRHFQQGYKQGAAISPSPLASVGAEAFIRSNAHLRQVVICSPTVIFIFF